MGGSHLKQLPRALPRPLQKVCLPDVVLAGQPAVGLGPSRILPSKATNPCERWPLEFRTSLCSTEHTRPMRVRRTWCEAEWHHGRNQERHPHGWHCTFTHRVDSKHPRLIDVKRPVGNRGLHAVGVHGAQPHHVPVAHFLGRPRDGTRLRVHGEAHGVAV